MGSSGQQPGCLRQWKVVHADTRTCYSDIPPYSSRPESSAQKALDALFLAAPVKGEVQPWVWLLRTVADTYGLDSVHDSICYLVRPGRTEECTSPACYDCLLHARGIMTGKLVVRGSGEAWSSRHPQEYRSLRGT